MSKRKNATNANYDFAHEIVWLTMKDGTKLSATIFRPQSKVSGEKFPALLELLPYRKDDSFYLRDYPIYSYFASRGYIAVKVDVRGTGSSQGKLPECEYSAQEIDDACEIIDMLSRLPDCNGSVGMWGISWGGFNAIQTAMRRPAALKAILAIHASDDLFHDDVHYIDGALHVNWYALEIDHENGLPRSPSYKLDAEYFKERLNATPWILTYLKHQRDSDFWRKKSLRWQYDTINVPVYLIGGLLDGYRDCVPRMMENLKVPVKAEIGPWNHDFPSTGKPGPNYEWRDRAVQFFDRWLKGKRNNIMREPFMVFVREGHHPDNQLANTPGHFRYEDWPIKRTKWAPYVMAPGGKLSRNRHLKVLPEVKGDECDLRAEVREPHCSKTCGKQHKEPKESLTYTPTAGIKAGKWWGEPTGDMRCDDAYSLVFDSPVLRSDRTVIGFPRVHLKVSVDAPVAHFIARLEDVAPDGSVSLVTGAGMNGSQRDDRLKPEELEPGKVYDISFDLHFTTWTFQKGHRIRVSVSNAQFPMIWPTPQAMRMTLFTGTGSMLFLPEIPEAKVVRPRLVEPQPRLVRDDAQHLETGISPDCHQTIRDRTRQTTSVIDSTSSAYRIGKRKFHTERKTIYTASDLDPARASFKGSMTTTIKEPSRRLKFTTTIEICSCERYFRTKVVRQVFYNGKRVKTRVWNEKVPRQYN